MNGEDDMTNEWGVAITGRPSGGCEVLLCDDDGGFVLDADMLEQFSACDARRVLSLLIRELATPDAEEGPVDEELPPLVTRARGSRLWRARLAADGVIGQGASRVSRAMALAVAARDLADHLAARANEGGA